MKPVHPAELERERDRMERQFWRDVQREHRGRVGLLNRAQRRQLAKLRRRVR